MPQIFRRSANGIAAMVLWGLAVVTAGSVAAAVIWSRSDFVDGTGFARLQPVPFSHEHHVGGLGIDCRYCHTGVETSDFAGVPPTHTCMTCHSQLWTNAEMLAPVRQSLETGEPLRWTRVHDLPDYVYFSHRIHIANGVGCESCHGELTEMPLERKAHSLTMSFCLSCHRNPEPNLRPQDAITTMHWEPPDDGGRLQAQLMAMHKIDPKTMTDCYVCHR